MATWALLPSLSPLPLIPCVLHTTNTHSLPLTLPRSYVFDPKPGFAEADPTADVEGIDVRSKIALLANLAFGQIVPTTTVPTTLQFSTACDF